MRAPEELEDLSIQSKGGKARAQRMTPEQRSRSASYAAQARWGKLNNRRAPQFSPGAFAVRGKFVFDPITTKSGYIMYQVAPGVFRDASGSVLKTFCMDCGEEEPMVFVVHDQVWKAAGLHRGYICWFCLEKRLGRPLRIRDLKKPEPPKHPILANKTILTAIKIAKKIKP